MSTDTPRTDAARDKLHQVLSDVNNSGKPINEFVGIINLACNEFEREKRQLERELTAETERSRKLAADLAADERGQENLRRMIEAEQEKVKRLREALAPLAGIPLEEFGWQRNPAQQIHGWNKHTIYVMDVLDARATLEATR